jgi:hypothetical protein
MNMGIGQMAAQKTTAGIPQLRAKANQIAERSQAILTRLDSLYTRIGRQEPAGPSAGGTPTNDSLDGAFADAMASQNASCELLDLIERQI